MARADLTSPDAVLRALAEFEKIGREQFLDQYGFKKARSYFLTDGGSQYRRSLVMTKTLVCDNARITPVRNDAIDMKFLMAGTDFVPRLRLLRERVLSATPEDVTRIVQRVVKSAIGCR